MDDERTYERTLKVAPCNEALGKRCTEVSPLSSHSSGTYTCQYYAPTSWGCTRRTRDFINLDVSYASLPLGPPIVQANSRTSDSPCSPLAELPRSRRKNPVFFLCSFFSVGGVAGVTTAPGSGGGPGEGGRLCPPLLPRLDGLEESAQSPPILGGGSNSCSVE